MGKITEKKIEQFIRFPQALNIEEQTAVERAMASSKRWQGYAAFFKKFYRLFNQSDGRSSSKNYVINLTQYQLKTDPAHPDKLVLAAQSGNTETETLRTIATLASEKDKTVVRVLDQKKSDQYQIHVLSNFLEPGDMSILSISEIDTDFVINEKGRLFFKPDDDLENYDWNNASVTLRIPFEKISFSVAELDHTGEKVCKFDDFLLRIKINEGRIAGNIESDTEDDPILTRVLTKGSFTEPFITHIADCSFLIPYDSRDSRLKIWLFK
jgi:hypothetical protein